MLKKDNREKIIKAAMNESVITDRSLITLIVMLNSSIQQK